MRESSFSRAGNALFWQATQQVGVNIISLIRLLILARLLSPDDFGLLAIASVAIDVLLKITNLGMIPALIQRIDADEGHYDVAWTVGILRALIVTGVTVLAAPIIAQLFAEPRSTDIIRVLAIYPLIDAGASIKVARLMRNLQFRSLAFVELPKALVNTLVAIALAQRLGVWALVAGMLAGSTTYLIISYLVAPYRPRLSLEIHAARSLIHFGQWIFFTGLIDVAGQSTLRLIISRQLGATELGLYYLATKLAYLPVAFAIQVVQPVAFSFYSRLQADLGQVLLAFRSILISLSSLLVPVSALLIALAPSLVDNVLGPNWQGTAPVIRVLALASIIGLLDDTIIPFLQGMGRPDRIFVLGVIYSSLLLVVAWVLTDQFGLVGAASAVLLATVAAQIAGLAFLRQILPRPIAGLGRPMGVIAAVSVIATGIALGVDYIVPGMFGPVLASLIGIAVAGGLLWMLERRFTLGISDGLARAFPRVAALAGLLPGQAE